MSREISYVLNNLHTTTDSDFKWYYEENKSAVERRKKIQLRISARSVKSWLSESEQKSKIRLKTKLGVQRIYHDSDEEGEFG